VPGVVGRVAVALDEVPAARVVDEAVAVVVDAVRLAAAAGLARVVPDVRLQIGLAEVDARVDDGHLHVGGPGRLVPGRGRVDVGSHRAGGALDRLARVLHAPLGAEEGVVRDRTRVDVGVRLGVEHARVALEAAHGVLDGLARRHAREHGARHGDPALQGGAAIVQGVGARGRLHPGAELHEHLARHVAGGHGGAGRA
jgi:hypothetical protein